MVWIRLLRPFTLLPPLLGMLSGAAAVIGAGRVLLPPARAALCVLLGAAMASLLNAASNVLNQLCDVELDRVNKPARPLVTGEVTRRQAVVLTVLLYAASLALAFAVRPTPVPELGLIVVLTAFLTWAYSAPPLRLRRSWWLAPLVIAVPRGGLLKVAGWATLAPVFSDREPWLLGSIFFLFVLGCAPTKDFEDMEGDRRAGAASLPLRFGPRRAALVMAPFYVLPWILLVLMAGGALGEGLRLSLSPLAAAAAGAPLVLHGLVTARRLVKDADALVGGRARRAWIDLYALMMGAQVLVGAAYLAG